MSDFSIRVDSDDLVFSASHFITFEGGVCESLHGHDYHAAAELRGPLNSSQYVIDFIAFHEVIKNILKQLDHRVLLARNHPRMKIHTIGEEVEISLGNRRWVLPKDDCLLLPVSNTTGEMMAQYVAMRISEDLSARKIGHLKHIRVEIREGGGFTSIYQLGGDE